MLVSSNEPRIVLVFLNAFSIDFGNNAILSWVWCPSVYYIVVCEPKCMCVLYHVRDNAMSYIYYIRVHTVHENTEVALTGNSLRFKFKNE